MSEEAVQLACRDINDELIKRYGKIIEYRIEYRVIRRRGGEASRYRLLFMNIYNEQRRQRLIQENGTWEETMTALAVIWHTIDVLPGHG